MENIIPEKTAWQDIFDYEKDLDKELAKYRDYIINQHDLSEKISKKRFDDITRIVGKNLVLEHFQNLLSTEVSFTTVPKGKSFSDIIDGLNDG